MGEQNTPEQGGNPAPEGKSEFQPITSQDELNRVIGERIARERSKYSDYDELKAKATKLDEVEEKNKTELQRATERASAAEKRAAEFEAREQRAAWATEVATATGVPAEVLRGSTREEIEAHAETLKPHFKPAPKQPRTATPVGRPAADTGSRAAAALRELRARGT